jgi:hypothetical protein
VSGAGGDDRTREAQGEASAGGSSREGSTGGLPSEALIRELARDLRPVRPIPPVHRVVAGLLGVWLAVAAVGVALLGWKADLGALLAQRAVLSVSLGLVAAGLGGLVAAVALGVPGRERLARGALLCGGAGLAVAAGVGTLLLLRSPAVEPGAPLESDLHCLLVASAVALLPALGVVAFAGRAAPHRPLVLAVAAAAGTVALGTVAAQASCPYADLRHLLMGHALAPALGALVLVLPLLVALRRTERAAGD